MLTITVTEGRSWWGGTRFTIRLDSSVGYVAVTDLSTARAKELLKPILIDLVTTETPYVLKGNATAL